MDIYVNLSAKCTIENSTQPTAELTFTLCIEPVTFSNDWQHKSSAQQFLTMVVGSLMHTRKCNSIRSTYVLPLWRFAPRPRHFAHSLDVSPGTFHPLAVCFAPFSGRNVHRAKRPVSGRTSCYPQFNSNGMVVKMIKLNFPLCIWLHRCLLFNWFWSLNMQMQHVVPGTANLILHPIAWCCHRANLTAWFKCH